MEITKTTINMAAKRGFDCYITAPECDREDLVAPFTKHDLAATKHQLHIHPTDSDSDAAVCYHRREADQAWCLHFDSAGIEDLPATLAVNYTNDETALRVFIKEIKAVWPRLNGRLV